MTKMHFQRAAEMVKAILHGEWTNEQPDWSFAVQKYGWAEVYSHQRAIQTAEAFIILFRQFNPRFNQQTFLVACGLAEPTKKGRTS